MQAQQPEQPERAPERDRGQQAGGSDQLLRTLRWHGDAVPELADAAVDGVDVAVLADELATATHERQPQTNAPRSAIFHREL